jgi:hypothetical protein
MVVAVAVITAAGAVTGERLLSHGGGGGGALPAGHRQSSTTQARSPSASPGERSTPTSVSTPTGQAPVGFTDIADAATVTGPPHAPAGTDSAGNRTSYVLPHLVDSVPVTAWRMIGDGSGFSIVFRYSKPVTVAGLGLINGYAKTDPVSGVDRYVQERRITAVTWILDGGWSRAQTLDTADPSLQRIRLTSPVTTREVVLRIDATVPGDPEFDYTAISEVEIVGALGTD